MKIKIVTVNIPESMIAKIKSLTGEDGLYPSRSELVRVAIREYLIKELRTPQTFMNFTNHKEVKEKGEKEEKEGKGERKEKSEKIDTNLITIDDLTYNIVDKLTINP